MYVIQIRHNLFLWMFFVTCGHFVSPDCLTGHLTWDDGAAFRDDSSRRFGCTSGCPYPEPEVHVLAQVGPSSGYDREVYVTLFNKCTLPADVKLVLISQEAVTWVVKHEEDDYDSGSSNNDNVNVKDIFVYQNRTQSTQLQSTVKGLEWAEIEPLRLTLDIPQTFQNRTAFTRLRNWLKDKYKVTSINYGRRPLSWELDINYECCDIERPVTTVPIFPFPRGTADPATPNRSSDSQGGAGHPKTIIIVVVIVVLTVVLIGAVILGTCWYYRRQKQKRPQASISRVPRSGDGGLSSLDQPTNVHAQANVYNLSPSAPSLP